LGVWMKPAWRAQMHLYSGRPCVTLPSLSSLTRGSHSGKIVNWFLFYNMKVLNRRDKIASLIFKKRMIRLSSYFFPSREKFLNVVLIFWHRALLCNSGWLELIIFLPQSPKCWDYRLEPSCLAYIFFKILKNFTFFSAFVRVNKT
jgi:hypothetical protein